MAIQIRLITETINALEYDCSLHTAEEWTVLFGTPRYAFGIWSFAFPTVCQILYIPALRVFYRERRLTCYKFMFLIALADMGGLCCIGSLFGYVMIRGGVYCSNPPLGLIVGSGEMCFWIISSTNCILLVINRMCELTDRAWVFKGWSSSMCMLATIVYGILELLFTRPPLPNSTHQFCDFNPYIPGHTADEYPNHSNMYHDMALVIALPFLFFSFLFVLLCGIVRSKTDQLSATHSSAAQAIQSKIFTQASIVCALFAAASAVWVAEAFFFVPPPAVLVAGIIVLHLVHGLPCFTYLALNRAVREEFRKMIGVKTLVTTQKPAFTSMVSVSQANSSAFL